ncbi:hypothetical protein [Halobacterium salinarum]|uniref:hypothetical protein n=1 Tax=Halobacterium salinarum TaxID=2242 RepID=UPI0025567008|nr:hypothetical protein [Halobacterium salinarum]MDL0126607.1 hypothetical protein [Halobacterium salinarum]
MSLDASATRLNGHSDQTEDDDGEATADELQAALVDTLGLDAFPRRGYRRAEYLTAALEAGFEPGDLATAHRVSERSIYRAIETHGLDRVRPPTSGLAERLWELDPDAVPGESA